MGAIRRQLEDTFWATTDVFLATFGLGMLFYPIVLTTNAMLGTPLTDSEVTLFVVILALGGSYPFVAGDWSLGLLGEYIFVFTASALGIGLLAAIGIVVFGIELSGSDPLPRAVLFAMAYFVSFVLVRKRQWLS
ncbi:hypothetical protein [Halorussus halophilus]|uniref:hypothetical protein n=1 Tax=Halorussus halophilus TaxID=2650975 RepID=UPI001300D74D|nr:hypothetical protein [Halorussus halophilus]